MISNLKFIASWKARCLHLHYRGTAHAAGVYLISGTGPPGFPPCFSFGHVLHGVAAWTPGGSPAQIIKFARRKLDLEKQNQHRLD